MSKDLKPVDYLLLMKAVHVASATAAENLAFQASGLQEGKEEEHRKILLSSVLSLNLMTQFILTTMFDEEEVRDAKKAEVKEMLSNLADMLEKKGDK